MQDSSYSIKHHLPPPQKSDQSRDLLRERRPLSAWPQRSKPNMVKMTNTPLTLHPGNHWLLFFLAPEFSFFPLLLHTLFSPHPSKLFLLAKYIRSPGHPGGTQQTVQHDASESRHIRSVCLGLSRPDPGHHHRQDQT